MSKSGGATAWPTMATRVALMSRPAFTPAAAARSRRTLIAGVVIPIGKRGEAVGELAEQIGQARILPEFFAGGGIVREVVAEKGAPPGGEIGQQARARTQQIHRVREPIALRAGPFLAPKLGAAQLRFDGGQQFLDRQFLQVLRVEPFELGAVEDGIGAADAGERKAAEQFVRCA